jgi:hypothetical protein
VVGLLLWFSSGPAAPPAPPAVPARPQPYRSTLAISNGGWGGDLVPSSTGDALLAYDYPGDPQATKQRIQRIVNTTPRQWDPRTGAVISRGDDPFHPDWGAGLPAQVDELSTPQLLAFIQGQILKGLAGDSSIAPTPPPIVIVSVADYQTVSVQIMVTLVSGQAVVLAGSDAANMTISGVNLA